MSRTWLSIVVVMSGCALEALPPLGAPCAASTDCAAGYFCGAGAVCVPGEEPPVSDDPALGRPEPLALIARIGETVAREIVVEGDAAISVAASAVGTVSVQGKTITFIAGGESGAEIVAMSAGAQRADLYLEVVNPAAFEHVWTGAAGDGAFNLDDNWQAGTAPVADDAGAVLIVGEGATARLVEDVIFKDVVVVTGARIDNDGHTITARETLRSGGDFTPPGAAVANARFVGHFDGLVLTAIEAVATAAGPVVTGDLQAFANNTVVFDVGAETIIVRRNLTIDDGAQFVMNDPNALVVVHGDALFRGTPGRDAITAGTFELLGNLQQVDNQGVFGETFACSGTHKTILRGTALQQISFQSPDNSGFHELVVLNGEGVLQGTDVVAGGNFTVPAGARHSTEGNGLDVGGIVVVEGELSAGALLIHKPTEIGADATFVVDRVIAFAGTDVLQPGLPYRDVLVLGQVAVVGDTTLSGALIVDRGEAGLSVGQARLVAASLTVDQGVLAMTDPLTVVEVTGAATFSSPQASPEQLTAGKLIVGGAFAQLVDSGVFNRTFAASQNHVVELVGNPQTVSFESGEASPFDDVVVSAGADVTINSTVLIEGDLTIDGALTVAASATLNVVGLTTVSGSLTMLGTANLSGGCEGACP